MLLLQLICLQFPVSELRFDGFLGVKESWLQLQL